MTNLEIIQQLPDIDASIEDKIFDSLECDDILVLISKTAEYHKVSTGQVLKVIMEAYDSKYL